MTTVDINNAIETIIALKQAKNALKNLATTWMRCNDAFRLIHFPEEVLDSKNYPFEKSFSDYDILDWINESLTNIDKKINEIKPLLNSVYGNSVYGGK